MRIGARRFGGLILCKFSLSDGIFKNDILVIWKLGDRKMYLMRLIDALQSSNFQSLFLYNLFISPKFQIPKFFVVLYG